jgi:hypothetical protein
MFKKKILLVSILLLIPNICYAYVDPGIFSLLWQSTVAFIFAALAYFRFLSLKTSNFFKKKLYNLKNKSIITILDYFLLLLVLVLPLLFIYKNNVHYYHIKDITIAIFNLCILFLIIKLIVSWVIKYFAKDKNYLFFITLSILILSYFLSATEEYIIKKFLNSDTIKYLRLISLIIVPIIIYYFIKLLFLININKIRKFFSFFIIFLVIISSIGLFKVNKNGNYKIWKYDQPNILETDLKDNVFFIFTDAYLSPKYYELMYPGQTNQLYRSLEKKKFFLDKNSFSSYSSSRFSIPSILNSNLFSDDINNKKLRESLENENNILDNSFLVNTLKKNQFNHKFIYCDFKYILKKRYCKEKSTYSSIIDDIPIIEGIYYYNTFYRIYKFITFQFYKKKIVADIIDKTTQDNEEKIEIYLEKQIKKNSNKKNFTSIYFSKPHSPFTLNEDCSWKSIPLSQNVKNGMLIKDKNLRINGYIDNLNCINTYLIKLIKIIEKYNEEYVIILLSDNGPSIRHEIKENIPEKKLKLYDTSSALFSVGGNSECLNNLNKKYLHHVNIFKIIFSCGKRDMYTMHPNNTFKVTNKNNKFNFEKINLDE